jgi:hypothetical protein
MQGTWPVLDHHALLKVWLVLSSFTKVLLQLPDCGLASERAIWGQWLQGVVEMRIANPETHITPPPQLNEVAEGINWTLTVAP